MSILVAADFTPEEWQVWWPALQAALPGERLLRSRDETPAAEIDIALVANPLPGALHGLSALKLIQSLWAGVDRLLQDATMPPEVSLARMVDPVMNRAMAETALWAVLSLQRGFFAYATQQQRRQWLQHEQRRADELCVAVLGLGQMGRAAAQRLASSGYRVLGWSSRPKEVHGVVTCCGASALAEVLRAAHILINLLPLTTPTRGLFNAATLGLLPHGASLVNLARGAHVVEQDLLAALDSGRLHHAVLDVFQTEPLPPEHVFWSHPRVTLLPHVAALTDARSASAVVARNVRALRQGRPLEFVVDRSRGY